MDLKLTKEISNATVISGFPGFGLVATIATEFLLEHLGGEIIGKYWFEDLPASIAIHDGKVINPITIFYNEKYNLVIVHSISGTQGVEWKAAELVDDVTKKVKAKELISLEGVGVGKGEDQQESEETKVFHYTTNEDTKKALEEKGIQSLKEGIIMGVTASLLLKSDIEKTGFFVETHSELPDSKAAAKLIEVLDKHIGMEIDYQPLLDTAVKFEEKLKGILENSQKAKDTKSQKDLSYLG
ncbi:MAG: proteasome assembly chaperone family protein [Nanobdellota archaeon]